MTIDSTAPVSSDVDASRMRLWVIEELAAGRDAVWGTGLRVYQRRSNGRVTGYGVVTPQGQKWSFATPHEAAVHAIACSLQNVR
jgi:hypothetical protein